MCDTFFFFFQAEDGIRDVAVTGVQTCALPILDMNPILLKPETDDRSQVVVRGRAIASLDWRGYGRLAPTLWPVVVESLERLRAAHDLVVIEGAGNPAEINLGCDLANMRVAAVAGAPVLLVGDIDRGGVFAALVGTLALLSPDDRARVAGLVVNRFRGDPSVLAPGLELLAARRHRRPRRDRPLRRLPDARRAARRSRSRRVCRAARERARPLARRHHVRARENDRPRAWSRARGRAVRRGRGRAGRGLRDSLRAHDGPRR